MADRRQEALSATLVRQDREAPQPADVRKTAPERPARPPSERYYRNSEVEVRARPVDPPPLVIPARAYIERIRGHVRLRVFINERGLIDAIEVTAAEPPGVFEEAAIRALAATRHSPAMRRGRPVKTVKEVDIAFDPYESAAHP